MAGWINEEGWLQDGVKADLTVIPLVNYTGIHLIAPHSPLPKPTQPAGCTPVSQPWAF